MLLIFILDCLSSTRCEFVGIVHISTQRCYQTCLIPIICIICVKRCYHLWYDHTKVSWSKVSIVVILFGRNWMLKNYYLYQTWMALLNHHSNHQVWLPKLNKVSYNVCRLVEVLYSCVLCVWLDLDVCSVPLI